MILLLLIPWLLLAALSGTLLGEGRVLLAIAAFLAAVAVGTPAFGELLRLLGV